MTTSNYGLSHYLAETWENLAPETVVPNLIAHMKFAMLKRGGLELYPEHINTIPTHMKQHELQTLYMLAKMLPAGARIVEIGSYLGASACCLAAGAKNHGAEIHCIDPFTNEAMQSQTRDTYPQFVENTQPYADMITVHKGYSQDVAGEIPSQIDLLFIDGDHSWEGVTQDLRLYLPLMNDGAILAMHDVGYWAGVRRALREIVLPIQTERLEPVPTGPNLYAGKIRPQAANFTY
jgi:predicted O-methyltransferase YrrM